MSLTLTEARERAALISQVSTQVHLDLTSADDFGVEATVRFACAVPGAETFLELKDATGVTVTLNGSPLDALYDGRRIALPGLAVENEVTVTGRLPYVTDGDGMNVLVDPADGERYVCALTAMDIAQKVLPCFDQPDLKTTFAVEVTAPAHWSVVANGVSTSLDRPEGRAESRPRTWTFAPTPPISTYLFVVCGGPWVSFTWDEPYGDGTLPFGWHARASQRAELERDADELRTVTSRCFQHYTSVFDEPYPFDDFQQVFVPGLNWGAMEFPGCVAYRDEMLSPGEPTAMERHWRTSVIAHEMAHMWFGDLVTMRWWEDSWLNESFAEYMGFQVADAAAGAANSWTAVALARKPTAYRADLRRSTHPIAEDAEALVDVDTAFNNFDMITYAKGMAALRQLVVWLGEDDFLAGVNKHLTAHAFGNATLADFLDALDSATDRDVRAWAGAWLRTTGFDRIVVTRDGGVPVLTRVGSRPHRFTVAAYDEALGLVGERLVDLADSPVALPEFAGRVVLPNALDETYAALEPDDASWQALVDGLPAIDTSLTRALVWATAGHLAESGLMPVADLVAMAGRHLAVEQDATVFEAALVLVLRVLRRQGDPATLGGQLADVAGLAEGVLRDGPSTLAPAAARALARTSASVAQLAAWLDGGGGLPEADQDVRWLLVQRLASLGDGSRIDAEAARDRTSSGAHAALTARASVPTVEAKESAFVRMVSGELSNRELSAIAHGLWAWEHADLVAPYVPRYLSDGLDLAWRSGQAMGGVIGDAFPWLPMSHDARRELRSALADTLAGDVPTVLRREWDDHLDDLDRVIAAVTGSPDIR
ncbi:aminopeptidase N [Nocardioides gansuensis]|uniref:Aminopeptidase N n=1 Tax=Nocardioides gansuensis TaxID=2138300 RepID=A0A2T8F7N8_9ACTN|nr:aminopeptidase N [Nocardioides gansuensis]PVG81734.1 aminopeptidase N [Nocardioides gansuensis]